MPRTDVVIIGSGIAGLSVAIKVARRFPDRQCLIITKQESAESNTRYAQGGIAVVSDFVHDSFESHVADTLRAGDGLCDEAVVRHVVEQAPERLRELIDLGAEFDRDEKGELVLGREGGHKANRIIHFQDITGLNISTRLLERVKTMPNVTILPHHTAIDLITSKDDRGEVRARGVKVLDLETSTVELWYAAATVMATGGAGQLYRTTTNPRIATGDGIAMAWRAGASVSFMEFVQFHPTALYDEKESPSFLISEAVRGQGAYLRNSAGERFMFRYHVDGELASRDIVARAISSEIQSQEEPFVYLDCTHIPHETVRKHFPNIYQTCLTRGIDLARQYIPVAPAAHYICGGIDVDLNSRTRIAGLYACGECSNTGLHGANRLASNSLLEATVFAHNCFLDLERHLATQEDASDLAGPETEEATVAVDLAVIADIASELQQLMSRYAGIVRTNAGLEHASGELTQLEARLPRVEPGYASNPAWYEVRNMLACARMVIEQSLVRKENRGGFYNRDLEVQTISTPGT